MKRSKKKAAVTKGDGSRNNPVRGGDDDEPKTITCKGYIRFMELDGSPGLTYRKGKTNHSYQWIFITVNSALNRCGSVLNIDLANVWPQKESMIMNQTLGRSAIGKPKTRNNQH